MALFKRFRNANKEMVHEAFERGQASFADEESDKIVPTIIGETSMVMDDAEAIGRDEQEIQGIAPDSPLAAEVADREKRALADVESAKTALADAQEAEDRADDAYSSLDKQYRRDEDHSMISPMTGKDPRYGEPGGPAQSEDAEVLSDRERIETDLATASAALADADAAKAQADEDLRRARGGDTGAPPN